MESFEKTIQVSEDDLDDLDHVNNVRYVQWMQDIAKEHWQTKAPKEMQDGVVWVVLKHVINYKSAAKLNDTIKIRTYIAKTSGATSIRVVEMFNTKTHQLLVRSETEWCLLDPKTKRPLRISEEIKNVFIKNHRPNTL